MLCCWVNGPYQYYEHSQINLLCILSFFYTIRIIFWDNSTSGKFFTMQKKIIRIMAGAQPRTSCRSLIKHVEILPVPCWYILSLVSFIINNQEIFQTNSSIHNSNTRNKYHLHRPSANLPCFQKSAFYTGIKFSTVYHPA
jgi:IS1 family transposase